jgi:hypothetical protein
MISISMSDNTDAFSLLLLYTEELLVVRVSLDLRLDKAGIRSLDFKERSRVCLWLGCQLQCRYDI